MVGARGRCYSLSVNADHHLRPAGPGATPQAPDSGGAGIARVATARLVLAYDGTDFHGWQVQPGGLRTVQGVLIDALRGLVPLASIPPGAGRTDAGVHARGQVASVPLVDPQHLERLCRALPSRLPADVVLREAALEGPDFHARFSAVGRVYRYRFTALRDPFLRRDHLEIDSRLDHEAMAAACAFLVGDHDATSLCRTASLEAGRTRCRIRRAQWHWDGERGWLEIEADRFLHSTVRIIVGTLLEIGRGLRPPDDFVAVLAARDRRRAGATAPPQGLSLERVLYPDTPSFPPVEE